jgi:hypothetical protein
VTRELDLAEARGIEDAIRVGDRHAADDHPRFALHRRR